MVWPGGIDYASRSVWRISPIGIYSSFECPDAKFFGHIKEKGRGDSTLRLYALALDMEGTIEMSAEGLCTVWSIL